MTEILETGSGKTAHVINGFIVPLPEPIEELPSDTQILREIHDAVCGLVIGQQDLNERMLKLEAFAESIGATIAQFQNMNPMQMLSAAMKRGG